MRVFVDSDHSVAEDDTTASFFDRFSFSTKLGRTDETHARTVFFAWKKLNFYSAPQPFEVWWSKAYFLPRRRTSQSFLPRRVPREHRVTHYKTLTHDAHQEP